jgi:hypothetical protein
MSRGTILAGATALHEFTTGQLAAYCGEAADAVEALLASAGPAIKPLDAGAGRRWRVLDPDAVRAEITRYAPEAPPRPGREPPDERVAAAELSARVVLAEETLVGCGSVESSELRRLRARSAQNHLRQCLASLDPGRTWWEIGPSDAERMAGSLLTAGGDVTPSRLRADIALASITESEATGQEVSMDYLSRAVQDFPRLADELDAGRAGRILKRFADLARLTGSPRSPGGPSRTAPARMLSSLAWRRAGARTETDVGDASRRLEALPDQLVSWYDSLSVSMPGALYRVLDHLPGGRSLVVVFADLLEIVPRQFEVQEKQEYLTGVLVEVVADADASRQLQEWAGTLEGDLRNSPYHSESALFGQVAHTWPELVARVAQLDSSVPARSTETQRELLTFVGAPL